MTAIKIGSIILAIGAILIFIIFGVLQEERPSRIPDDVTPSPTQDSIFPSIPNATATVPVIPQPSAPTEKEEGVPPAEETVSQLPACEYLEFIIKILDADAADPPNLTIHIGDTVTFINEDDDLRWPGADPHPTHSSLPLFDALGGISQGQSYSHTFNKDGAYGWHDHLLDNPPVVGFITVLPCL